MMRISFNELPSHKGKSPIFTKAGCLVFGIGEDKKMSPLLHAADAQSGGAIARMLKAPKFEGKFGQHLALHAPSGLDCSLVLVVGYGKAKEMDEQKAERFGGNLVPLLNRYGFAAATMMIDAWPGAKADPVHVAAHAAFGAALRAYRFDRYRTKEKPEDKPTLSALAFSLKGAKAAEAGYVVLGRIAEAVHRTRDIVSEPANVITPESLAAHCRELTKLGLEVEVLGEAAMKKLGMGALLGVGQGSAHESQLVAMRWKGAPKNAKQAPLAFVGKGVTFDTGGISIKPAGGMEEMKWDMGGAAAVIGLMRALASRKAKVNAVGVVGLVENMPDGKAQRPGDVVRSMSGQTVEVINTDAEGRLVLCDALWYAQRTYDPSLVVNLATLTGAIIVALGTSRAGLFSNNDQLAERLFEAGKSVDEELWRLPLGEVYDKQINSDIADMKNVGEGREAGSITAAQFLQRFIDEGRPWAHLDIAGVAWSKKDSDTCPKGATAFGVRLLDRFVAEYYEKG